jgi:Cd2+/Zn2+-exporting ATPase
MEAMVTSFAKIYTPIVIVSAILTMIIPMFMGYDKKEWFYNGLIVIVVACPCALVIATPIVVVSGIGVAALRGVIIKSG